MSKKCNVEITVIRKSVFTVEVKADESVHGDILSNIYEVAQGNVDGGEYDKQINDSSVIDDYDFYVYDEEDLYEQ
jgi:hypothetical protein